MAPKHFYKIEVDGHTVTRKTDRTYTHVITGRRPSNWTEPGKLEAITWCGRPGLAMKKANSREVRAYDDVQIIEIPGEEDTPQAPAPKPAPKESPKTTVQIAEIIQAALRKEGLHTTINVARYGEARVTVHDDGRKHTIEVLTK